MSFSPPTTFSDGTVVTSANLEGNFEALRVYLHGGVVAGDVQAAQWIDTRHIQPPSYEPFSGVQHGVTGHQGGNDSGLVRLTFCTKYLTGGGREDSQAFEPIPGTAITLDCRRACTAVSSTSGLNWNAGLTRAPRSTSPPRNCGRSGLRPTSAR